jgi:hypothetical protein
VRIKFFKYFVVLWMLAGVSTSAIYARCSDLIAKISMQNDEIKKLNPLHHSDAVEFWIRVLKERPKFIRHLLEMPLDDTEITYGDWLRTMPMSITSFVLSTPLDISWVVPQKSVSYESFNSLGVYPVYLYGLTSQVTVADGREFTPADFMEHDSAHNGLIFKKSQRNISKAKRLSQISDLLRFEIGRQNFMQEMPDQDLRPTFEMVYFYMWHEHSKRADPAFIAEETSPARQAGLLWKIKIRARDNDLGRFSEEHIQSAIESLHRFTSGYLSKI